MSYPFVKAFYDYGVRKGPMKAFVIHMAEGGGTVGYLSKANPNHVSVHYVIERTGRIVQMLQESHASGSIRPSDIRTTNDADGFFGATAAKAVMGDWWKDPNSAVISVEIEGYASIGPNDVQNVSLKKLVADVRSRYPEMGLLGHRDFADYKACPGRKIIWNELGGHGPAAQEDEVRLDIAGPTIGQATMKIMNGSAFNLAGTPRPVPVGFVRNVYAETKLKTALSASLPVGEPMWLVSFEGEAYLMRKADCTYVANPDATADAYNAGLGAAQAAVAALPRR